MAETPSTITTRHGLDESILCIPPTGERQVECSTLSSSRQSQGFQKDEVISPKRSGMYGAIGDGGQQPSTGAMVISTEQG